MTRIAVIDHGAGNLVSIAQGLRVAGADVEVVDRPSELRASAGVVLPGVGTTGAAMRRLEAVGWAEALRELDRPLLGICVGMQLLFTASDEQDAAGLGILPGTVRRLDANRLPHSGCNDVDVEADPLFAGLGAGTPFYFVHSYAPVPVDPTVTIARTTYEAPFVSAVRRGSVSGVQFHPERSGPAGLRLLANFVAGAREAAHAA